MLSSLLYKVFPPPKFLTMAHAGLDISDDAIRSIEYGTLRGHAVVKSFTRTNLPTGLSVGGDSRDGNKLSEIMRSVASKASLSYVKVSVPEEKAYLFQIDVPNTNPHSIRQNIESKLEENVPLSAKDALFYFDIIPYVSEDDSDTLKASVTVVPRTYIDHMIKLVTSAGMKPISFETVPKALARVAFPSESQGSAIIVHVMGMKTGLYLVCGGVVCFTSTIMRGGKGSEDLHRVPYEETVASEIHKISDYWTTRMPGNSVSEVIVVGHQASECVKSLEAALSGNDTKVSVPNIWSNVIDIEKNVPTIPKEEALDYAVAAGLAIYS